MKLRYKKSVTGKIHFVVIAISFLLCINNLFSQTTINDFTYTIEFGENPTNGKDSILITCKINLPEAELITAIRIKVGSKEGGADIFAYSFDNDENGPLLRSLSYEIDGNQVTLGLGAYPSGKYYYEVWIEDGSEHFSEHKKWNNIN